MQETAIERSAPPANGFGEMIQRAPQPQGAIATVVPLDRETLKFYGDMVQAAGLVPMEKNVSQEMSKFRVMAKIVAGTSYGFDPILSQQCFDVLYNRMTPNAHGMEILFKDSGEFDTRIIQLDDVGCKVKVLQRHNGEWDASRGQYFGGQWFEIGVVEFTVAMAKTAGWDTNALWRSTPADMCYSKVMKRVVKRFNPTCLRPRMLLGNHFAKAHQVDPTPPPIPTPAALTEPTPSATEAPLTSPEGVPHSDTPYTGPEAAVSDDDGPEAAVTEHEPTLTAEFEPVADEDEEREAIATQDDPDLDSATEDLRIHVQDSLSKLLPSRRKDLLAGKPAVSKMDGDELKALNVLISNDDVPV